MFDHATRDTAAARFPIVLFGINFHGASHWTATSVFKRSDFWDGFGILLVNIVGRSCTDYQARAIVAVAPRFMR